MTKQQKILKAVEIAKAHNIHGKFRFYTDDEGNNVDLIHREGACGVYCSINVRSGKVHW